MPATPPCDSDVVLSALQHGPLEPGDSWAEITFSEVGVLVRDCVSQNRMEELHALSVHKECCRFLPGDAEVVLRPNPAFHPQVWSDSHASQSIELHPFNPPQDGQTGLRGHWSLLCGSGP